MPRRYWLMKCEPSAYTIDDLQRDKTTSWEGVRNYQARNIMRDEMQEGRRRAVLRLQRVLRRASPDWRRFVRAGYPDYFAWKKGHAYFDKAGSKDAPVWFMVDIGFVERFPAVVSLETLKATKGLEHMTVTQKGSRLSVQPCTKAEYDIVVKLGRAQRVS